MLVTVQNRSQSHLRSYRGSFLWVFLLMLPRILFADSSEDPTSAVPGRTAPTRGAVVLPNATIGSINIINGSVFDLDDPEENKALFRLANRLHVKTRPSVIQQQLLFDTGDQASAQKFEESERILRSNLYIQDAKIEPVPNDNGVVDIDVQTTDVWTLIPKISLSRSGGKNKGGIGVKEMNLLGTGIELEAAYKSNVDRDSTIIRFADRNLGSSWYSLDGVYANSSDGQTYGLAFGKPFYALDTVSAFGSSFLDNGQIDSLYDRGKVLAEFEHHTTAYEVFKGWSAGLVDGWTKRISTGVAYDEHRFSDVVARTAPIAVIPGDRKLVYPFVGIEFLQDKYEKAENLEQISRVEDRYLGTRFTARVGLASTAFGSDRNAWIINAGAQTGIGNSQKRSLLLESDFATRVEDGGLQDALIGLSAKYYQRQSEKRLFYAGLHGTYGYNLDIDNQVLLGGDSGLRGYPLRYQAGDKSLLLTLEQRYFTDWYPWRLFRIGGAVFFDMGRTWGDTPVSDGNNALLKDVGFGLRIGNPRSGQGRMAHIDIAFPLDGDQGIKNVQLVIETKKSF
jgi:hypothetical protein